MHSVLTRGALGEVVNLTKPMIESGLGGLDRPCVPKNGHIWLLRPQAGCGRPKWVERSGTRVEQVRGHMKNMFMFPHHSDQMSQR